MHMQVDEKRDLDIQLYPTVTQTHVTSFPFIFPRLAHMNVALVPPDDICLCV